MAQNGNNIIVYALCDNSGNWNTSGSNWVAIAATKSDELMVDSETIEIASATEQDWKRCIAGRKSWNLNVSWLVTAVGDIRKVLEVGTRVKLRIGGRTFAAGSGLTGFAIVKTAKVTMTRGNLSNGSFAFVGDGSLT